MRKTYRIIAWLIGALVVLQAAAIAFAIAGLVHFVDGGGVVDKALVESEESPFPEVVGFIIHGINGGMVLPVLALVLMGVSFGAKFPGSKKWAGIVLLLVAIQVFLGYALYGVPSLGFLHGANALLLLGAAVYAGLLAGAPADTSQSPAAAATTT